MKRLAIIAVLLAGCLNQAWAEPSWKASLSLGEEYTDNVEQEQDGEEDFITVLTPRLSYARDGARLQASADYKGDYRYYARQTRDEEFNHDLRAKALLDAWDSFLFLEASDVYRLVNSDRTRGDAEDGESTVDLVQQNTFRFSPYIEPRFGNRGGAKIGYAFTNIWYNNDDGDSKNIHTGFLDADYEMTAQTALLSGYSYTQELSDEDTLDRHIVYLGASHAYSEDGSVYIKVGPQYTRYRERDSSSSGLYWDAGLNHDFGLVQLELTSGVTFEDDPDTGETYERRFGTLRLSKSWERTLASVFASIEDYEESADGGISDESGSVRRTALGLSVSHDITSRLKASARASHDFKDDDDDTKRWFASLGLDYALGERTSLGCWYRFKDSSSDDADEDYRVNSAGVRFTMNF
jgi:hypothetical protein